MEFHNCSVIKNAKNFSAFCLHNKYIYNKYIFLQISPKLLTKQHAFIVGPIFAFISALSLFSAGAGFKGFLSIILGILQLVARKKLVDFKADAPKFVYWVYGLDIFMAFTSISFSASAVWSIIVGIIILVCNVKYFRRRKHLFVN